MRSFAFDAVAKGKSIEGIKVVNKSGMKTIQAKVIIDATGDGDIAAAAGLSPQPSLLKGEGENSKLHRRLLLNYETSEIPFLLKNTNPTKRI